MTLNLLRRHLRALCAFVGGGGVVACQLFVTLASDDLVARDVDATVPVVDEAGVTQPSPLDVDCGRSVPPPPPATLQALPVPPRFFVIRSFDPSLDGGAGFNLDCVDTNCDLPSPPPPRCLTRDAGRFCDEPNGGDNHALVAASNLGLGLETQPYVDNLNAGRTGIVIALLGYSGEPNDSEVRVSVFPTVGVHTARGCDAGLSDAAPAIAPPRFDGCDVFWAERKHVNQGVPVVTARGYVTDRTLVVGSFRSYAPYGIRVFEWDGDVLEAKLDVIPDSGPPSFRLRGIVAGRIGSRMFLPILGEQREPGKPAQCEQPGWDEVRRLFCTALDMAAAGADAGEPCDAVSLQTYLEADPIELSDLDAPPRPLAIDRCLDAGADASMFTCL